MVLAVTKLTVSNFRSYDGARIETDPRPVVLTGQNGAGKTNLLEAVSFLAPGRGLRRAKLSEVQRLDVDGPWGVAATLETDHGPVDIGTGRDPNAEVSSERRIVRINGAPARSQTALADYVAMAWLTPAMDRLFQEGAGERRRFLDRLVFSFDPSHAGRLTRYEKALRERARLLRDERRPDPAWLTALEEELATSGVAISAARRDLAHRLDVACQTSEGPFPRARVAVAGVPEDLLDGPALAVEDEMKRRLAASRSDDGGSTPGPHRSDLLVRHVAKDMPAELCSTGEQKALLIALVLAHTRLMTAARGMPPILLLDEVVAHLDAERRSALFSELVSLGAQAWMTGTDVEVFAGLSGQANFFSVADGKITSISE